jgi:hypothetical protein
MVRLNTGEVAVVSKVNATDPYRPQVRVLFDREKKRIEIPYVINLWEASEDPQQPASVVAPVDPAEFEIDALMAM